jgi:hypothetical protein
MSFKSRLVEENVGEFLDKTKNAIKNNPGISATLGGAGLGALLNYAGDGGDALEQSRIQDKQDWLNTDAREELGEKSLVPKDVVTDIRDAGNTRNDGATLRFLKWLGGGSEDMNLFARPKELDLRIAELMKKYPNIEFSRDDSGVPHMSVAGIPINMGDRSDEAYDDYSNEAKLKYLKAPLDKITDEVKADKDLSKELASQEQDIKDATKDSYIRSTLAGAALGVGGVFAKRQLDKRRELRG